MRIIIGGDIVPTDSNVDLFSEGDVRGLLGQDLLDLWSTADIRIFNLEVPLTDHKNEIEKCGPNLIAPTSTIRGLASLKPTLVALANNHIFDHGEQGVQSTFELLNQNDIAYTGIGSNITEASKPYILEANHLKIGIYACAEHEFSIATKHTPGANPFDPLESLDHIKDLKERCDYVIVLYHGGKEFYQYPSPNLRKTCIKMAQKGADVVICQHSHCIGSYEKYNDSTLIYGQGNFLFDDFEPGNDLLNSGVLVDLSIEEHIKVAFIPMVKEGSCIRLAKNEAADKIISALQKRSLDIMKPEFIEQHYIQYAKKVRLSYIRRIAGFGKWLSRIDRKLFKGLIAKYKYNKKEIKTLQNYLECEAHRELILASLKDDKR